MIDYSIGYLSDRIDIKRIYINILMGTEIQRLFLKPSFKLKATETPYIKHLDENIFRSGAINEYTQN